MSNALNWLVQVTKCNLICIYSSFHRLPATHALMNNYFVEKSVLFPPCKIPDSVTDMVLRSIQAAILSTLRNSRTVEAHYSFSRISTPINMKWVVRIYMKYNGNMYPCSLFSFICRGISVTRREFIYKDRTKKKGIFPYLHRMKWTEISSVSKTIRFFSC